LVPGTVKLKIREHPMRTRRVAIIIIKLIRGMKTQGWSTCAVFEVFCCESGQPVTVLTSMQKSTLKYIGTLIKYIKAPVHTPFVAGGS